MVESVYGKALMTGWLPPELIKTAFLLNCGIHRKGGMLMTAYEIVMIILGILALLVSFGGLIIALLTFLDKRNRKK